MTVLLVPKCSSCWTGDSWVWPKTQFEPEVFNKCVSHLLYSMRESFNVFCQMIMHYAINQLFSVAYTSTCGNFDLIRFYWILCAWTVQSCHIYHFSCMPVIHDFKCLQKTNWQEVTSHWQVSIGNFQPIKGWYLTVVWLSQTIKITSDKFTFDDCQTWAINFLKQSFPGKSGNSFSIIIHLH